MSSHRLEVLSRGARAGVAEAGAGDGVDGGEQRAETGGLQSPQLLTEPGARCAPCAVSGGQQLRQATLNHLSGHVWSQPPVKTCVSSLRELEHGTTWCTSEATKLPHMAPT